MKKVFVIIVSYNGMNWINECLISIYKSTIEVEVLVIDNGSKDETVVHVKNNFPQVVLFEQKENLGFGKANNIGLKYALKNDYDYVFLLNQDAFLERNTLEKLINTSQKNKDYGILSPIHLNNDGKKLESYFSDFINPKLSGSFYPDHIINKEIKNIYPINFINAAAWLIPIETLRNVGGFDPIFWHYGEDDNYCQRVLFHGYKIGIVPNVFIKHDSKIRTTNLDYNFSEKYYLEYVKNLQTKFGNINYNFNVDLLKYESKKIIKEIIICTLSFKLNAAFGHFKKFKYLKINVDKILNSRKLNVIKAPLYID